MIIHNKRKFSLLFAIPVTMKICKCFYSEKSMGHLYNILHGISRNTSLLVINQYKKHIKVDLHYTAPNLNPKIYYVNKQGIINSILDKSSINKLVLPEQLVKGSQTELPENLLQYLDSHIELQKSLFYNIVFFKYILPYQTSDKLKNIPLIAYMNPEKQNIVCCTINPQITSSNKALKMLNTSINQCSTDPQIKLSIRFLLDKTVPSHPLFKLGILERSLLELKFTRGYAFQIIVNEILASNDSLAIKAMSLIHIENVTGMADYNFVTEVLCSHEQNKLLLQHDSDELKIHKVTMIYKNIPNSADEKLSIAYTGQKNCDMKIDLECKHKKTTIFQDIKQTVLSDKDFNHLYLKTTYNIKYLIIKTMIC
jgi:hypothetical protein